MGRNLIDWARHHRRQGLAAARSRGLRPDAVPYGVALVLPSAAPADPAQPLPRTLEHPCERTPMPQMLAMNATNTPANSPAHRTDLAVAHVLAQLLEKLENSAVPVGAEQYRSVVMHLVEEFRDVDSGADL